MTTVRVEDLGPLGAELGSGGEAAVVDLPHLSLPGVAGPFVYKRYHPHVAPDPRRLRELIDLRDGLDDRRRSALDAIAAWPLRMVADGPAIRGVVLPRIPGSFVHRVQLPSGAARDVVREVQHLFVDPVRCARIGMPVPTADQRLRICRDFAGALTLLHDPAVNVAFGDINAKNELWRLDEEPGVMFVDCDAARVRGSVTAAFQLNAPDWTPPERSGALSQQTDLYKLGLFVLRCLTPGDQGSTRVHPDAARDVLDDEGIGLLIRAVGTTPADRPAAGEWLRHLSLAIGDPLDPPVLSRVELSRTFVLQGEPLSVIWTAVGADAVEVAGPGCATVVADARAGHGRVEIRPGRGGSLTVTARNNKGTVDVRTPPVTVADLTGWSDLPVPAPRVEFPADALPVLPDVGSALALSVPTTPRVGAMELPAVAPAFELVPLPAVIAARDAPDPVDLTAIFLSRPDKGPSARKGSTR
ncbi:hypothetical protein [Asanoa siamensis]|uniref:Protein kinase domain-containing protein n=1 Tax=Asanoa siamensis TaxID=926357 RepID=A0ABQ4CRJ8_9ACTN|nr:hypothetical protein [Asanoa siamensis]GIF73924.1 hypothetical protein Asi02nite_34420 [Asanoa siamensis]